MFFSSANWGQAPYDTIGSDFTQYTPTGSEDGSPIDPSMIASSGQEFNPQDPLASVRSEFGPESIVTDQVGILAGHVDAIRKATKILRNKDRCYILMRASDQGCIRTDRRRKPVSCICIDDTVETLNMSAVASFFK